MCKKKAPSVGPQLVVITGGLGSGKSSVLSILKDMGHVCIDVDQFAKEVLERDQKAIDEVRRHFGKEALDSNGRINRPFLRELIISDEKKRYILESIVHPRVLDRLKRELESIARRKDVPFIFVEVPLLFEVGWDHFFDWVICVWTDEEKALKRVSKRHSVDMETAKRWLSLQMPLDEKVKRSHYVIWNVGDEEELHTAVQDMIGWLEKETLSCRRCN